MRLPPLIASLVALYVYAPHAAQPVETLRIGMRDDPDILDPTFSRTYVGTVVMTAPCDKLFDFDATLNIVPVLATGYEWAERIIVCGTWGFTNWGWIRRTCCRR